MYGGVGRTYMAEVFRECLDKVLQSTPKDHRLYAEMEAWSQHDEGDWVLWDAVLYYPAGVEWREHVPQPVMSSKQIGFVGGQGDETGVFLHNDCNQPPVDSDWRREVRQAMATLPTAGDTRGNAP